MRFDQRFDWPADPDPEATGAEGWTPPSELALDGPGPFHLPACREDIQIFNDGEVAVVMFTTMRGQRVGVPIPSFALRNLGLALISAASARPR